VRKLTNYSLFAFCLVLFSQCSVKKYIPEDELLLTSANVKVISPKVNHQKQAVASLEKAIFPQPNKRVLGMYPGLYYRFKAKQKEKPNFFIRFLNKRIGERPVYLSSINKESTVEVMYNRLENSGFFLSEIEAKVEENKKKAKINYLVKLSQPYTLQSLQVDVDASIDTLAIWDEIKNSLAETKLVSGSNFNLESLKNERQRIDAYLKSRGYYNFNPNFLLFEVDTNTQQKRSFNAYLRLKEEVPEKALFPYEISSIKVYPNSSSKEVKAAVDTTRIGNTDFIQTQETFFLSKRLKPFVLIKKDDLYSPRYSRYTSRRLSSIGTYRFVNIDYEENDSLTSPEGKRKLDAFIYLTPNNKRSLRFETQAVTKSNNFTGPNVGITYLNRNIFKGGELLRLNANTGYERQFFGSNADGGLSSIQVGLKSSLEFPRLLFPIDANDRFEYAIPKTKIGLGVDYLNRTNLYTLNSISTSFGYQWDANARMQHSINPINIEFVSLGNTSSEFEEILNNNPFLRRSFEQQFIAGLTYSFTYNRLKTEEKFGSFWLGTNIDVAGNTLQLLSSGSGNDANFFGFEFAQYAKTDVELRYHLDVGENDRKIVTRLFGGIGLPYGNSSSLPFVKQYFAGGPYSVRAFRIRSLGPGTYQPEAGNSSFFDQAGDIRLEANIEYRFPIFSYLKGALFYDAGNVWLLNENEALPGGKFSSNFLDEVAMGAGVGLRIDFQGFVLRFDFAAPLKRPRQSLDFEVRKTLLNFAIGYPF